MKDFKLTKEEVELLDGINFREIDNEDFKYTGSCHSKYIQYSFIYKSELSKIIDNSCNIQVSLFYLGQDRYTLRIEDLYIKDTLINLSEEFVNKIKEDIIENKFYLFKNFNTTTLKMVF